MPISITVPGVESFDDDKQQFVTTEEAVLVLEHSLVSLSKWESVFHKPFLGRDKKTSEETLAYIQAMSLNEIDGAILFRLSEDNIKEINDYIEDPMTATTFSNTGGPPSREIITNEIIRSWMVSYQIPLEYENRHLNQLFTLIKVINEKNKPQKKMSAAEIARRNSALNEARQKQYGTTG
jgi:hypothetical protein